MGKPIPKEQVIIDLSKRLDLDLFIGGQAKVNEEPQTVEFFIADGPQIIGMFKDSIFNNYPDKIVEVFEELVKIIQGEFPVLPKGKFQIECSHNFAAISCGSEHGTASCGGSYNAYGFALHFLRDGSATEYIASLKGRIALIN